MTAAEQKSRLTVEEYLDFETRSFEIKHEYLASILKRHLRAMPCHTFMADMKLRIDGADAFFYPGVFVTCDRRDLGERLPAALQEYWLLHTCGESDRAMAIPLPCLELTIDMAELYEDVF